MARVVIVDDSLLIRRLMRDILTKAGHEVVGEAEDGGRAPVVVREQHPDLVTLDLVMPGRGGLAALQHMLAIDPSLAVVVCSASLSQAKVIEALRLGAKAFIVKPLDRQRVLDGVRNALEAGDERGLPGPARRVRRVDRDPGDTRRGPTRQRVGDRAGCRV